MTRPIYIEGRFTSQRLTGVQRYACEIVRAIDRIAGTASGLPEIVLIQPDEGRSLGLANIEERKIASGTGHKWTQLNFARAARDGVALSLAASGPLLHRRQLVVIHDAAVFRHPEFYSRAYRTAHRLIDRTLARTANIGTVSQFSRSELADVLRLPPERILVAPNSVEHIDVAPDPDIVHKLDLRDRPYFVILGSLTPNKNLAVAVRALRHVNDANVRLVAIGDLDHGVFGRGQAFDDDRLILPGRLEDAEVAGLMRSARALLFPSIYEGFGIPPLEALANGCPVLASTTPAVREVCADAADYFDPHDDAALARLMQSALADDGSWRAERLARGRERLSRYSWESSARLLLDACTRLSAS